MQAQRESREMALRKITNFIIWNNLFIKTLLIEINICVAVKYFRFKYFYCLVVWAWLVYITFMELTQLCSRNKENNKWSADWSFVVFLFLGHNWMSSIKSYLNSFFRIGARWGWVVKAMPRPFYPRGREPVPIVQEARWGLGPVWTDTENLATTGIRSSDRPARSESLYRLSYPGQCTMSNVEVQSTG
jgi:hypothetical protein